LSAFPLAEIVMDAIPAPVVIAEAPFDAIRKPLVVAAALAIVIALAVELGSRLWIAQAIGVPADTPRPGLGVQSLAAVDALLTMSLVIIATSAVGLSPQVLARASGCVTTIISLLTLLASLVAVFAALGLLLLMVGLLLAWPFGTAVYMAVFGHFNRSGAAVTLGIVMLLKLVSAALAFLGNPHILKSKSLILLFLTSLLLTFVLAYLHGLPPGFLVSITDAIGAIVAYILAIIWAIAYLIGGVIGLLGNLQGHGRKAESR
jgi:hypothetical protein